MSEKSSAVETTTQIAATTTDDKVDEESSKITIKVVDQEGNELLFRMKKSTPFRRMFKNFCERNGHQLEHVRFLYDGERIDMDSNARNLQMQDEDVVDVVISQVGGDCD